MSNRVRAVGGVSVITLISRVTGYLRDKVFALILGAGMEADAFIVAFRIPNLFRALLAEGALHAAFIPVFSDYKKKKQVDELWRFAGAFLYSLTFVLVVITFLGILFSPLIVKLFAKEFAAVPGKYELTVILNRWMFPYLFFISLAGLFQGILNSHDRFYLPAATPILLNISMILCGAGLSTMLEVPAYGFAAGVLVGGFLQMVTQAYVARKLGLSLFPSMPFAHPAVLKVCKLMIPGLFVLGIYEINQLIGTRFAAQIGNSAVSYLYYAYRVTHLVYGGVVVALFTVFLPGLSRETEDQEKFLKSLTTGINIGLIVTLPAMAGLFILGPAIIKVLFEGGRFTSADTPQVAEALGYYALSLPAYAMSRMLASAFFAHKDTRTPAIATAADLVVFVSSCFLLVPHMAHSGIALATTLGGYTQVVAMAFLVRRKGILLPVRKLAREWSGMVISTLVMSVILLYLSRSFSPASDAPFLSSLFYLIGSVAAGFTLYTLTCLLLKVPTLTFILGSLKDKSK